MLLKSLLLYLLPNPANCGWLQDHFSSFPRSKTSTLLHTYRELTEKLQDCSRSRPCQNQLQVAEILTRSWAISDLLLPKKKTKKTKIAPKRAKTKGTIKLCQRLGWVQVIGPLYMTKMWILYWAESFYKLIFRFSTKSSSFY